MKEIVGAMIGTIITKNPADIIRGLKNNTVTRLLSKQEMQFMASCDLGGKWEVMANSRVLFFLDEDGNPFPASLPNKSVQPTLESGRKLPAKKTNRKGSAPAKSD